VTEREIGRATIAEALELTALRADGTGCAETASPLRPLRRRRRGHHSRPDRPRSRPPAAARSRDRQARSAEQGYQRPPSQPPARL